MLGKQWILFGTISGFFAVILGAFGAHLLKDKLSEKAFVVYQTAVHYQMFHALALMGLGLWALQNGGGGTQLPGYAFILGILFFSGSLYALALTDLRILGAVAPVGGLSFLVGWIAFSFLAWRA